MDADPDDTEFMMTGTLPMPGRRGYPPVANPGTRTRHAQSARAGYECMVFGGFCAQTGPSKVSTRLWALLPRPPKTDRGRGGSSPFALYPLDGVFDQFPARGQAQLGLDVFPIGFDSLHTEMKHVGDLPRAVALAD